MLDAMEVVLGLRVHGAEDRIGVRVSVNMSDSPGIAHDGDRGCLAAPAGLFHGARRRVRERDRREIQNQ